MVTRESVLNFSLAEYVRHGGFEFIPGKGQVAYVDAKKTADEVWDTENGSICTYNTGYYAFEFLYAGDSAPRENGKNSATNLRYCGNQIEFYRLDQLITCAERPDRSAVVLLSSPWWLPGLADVVSDASHDHHELVLFARSGANLHFNIMRLTGVGEVYLISKVTSASEATRNAVRRIMTPALPSPEIVPIFGLAAGTALRLRQPTREDIT